VIVAVARLRSVKNVKHTTERKYTAQLNQLAAPLSALVDWQGGAGPVELCSVLTIIININYGTILLLILH
jgi:hypothetical protein